MIGGPPAPPRHRGIRLRLGIRRDVAERLDQDLAVPLRDRVGAHRVATDQRLAVGEIEFPIVPVSGQDEIRPERALARRITFVRAAIGNREHAPALGDEEHLLADLSHELAAAGVECCA